MLRISTLVATVFVLALDRAQAYTCSQTQAQEGFGLFKAAAARSGCAPYVNYGADGGVTINWSCSTTSCTPTMMQLALQLPNCETPTDGINRKTTLEDQLYTKCQLCTPDQQNQIVALWKSAAQTSACAPYATASGSWFSWPCSATSCTATLKELANKVPSCIIGSQNERARILNGISTCTGTTVTTRTPSAGSTPSDASTTTPSTTTKPPTESTSAPSRTTTPAPPSSSSSSSSNESSSSGFNEESTPAPATTASSTACSATQIEKVLSLFVDTASSTNCKSYGTVSTYGVRISAPCSSSCVVLDVNTLADELPNCFYAYEGENKKQAVLDALVVCKPMSGRERMLTGDATEKYLSLQVDAKDVIKSASNSSSSNTKTTAPAMSSAPPSTWKATWLMGALLVLAAAAQ